MINDKVKEMMKDLTTKAMRLYLTLKKAEDYFRDQKYQLGLVNELQTIEVESAKLNSAIFCARYDIERT